MNASEFAIFPCRGKVPLTPHGCKDASTDADQIRAWEQRWPDANWAIATGSASGGLLVVDVDGIWDEPGAAWTRIANECGLNRVPGGLRTVCGLSGSEHSMHWYFQLDEGLTLGNTTGRLAPGIDTRCEGGYVIAPRSRHPDGGTYEWVMPPGETPIVEAPAMLIDLLQPLPRQPLPRVAPPLIGGEVTGEGKRRLLGIVRRVEAATKGERHMVVFWAACRIGELVATNHVDAAFGIDTLRAAAGGLGFTQRELHTAERAIRDGVEIGGVA
jgi:hypothetical protein